MKERFQTLLRSKFYTRILGYLLAVLLFSAFFLALNSLTSYRLARQRYEEQLQQRLDTSSSVVASQISMAYRLGSAFFQEYNTIMFFKPEQLQSVESQSEVWRVQEMIKKSETAFHPLVHSIFAYFPSDDTVLTSAGKYEKDFFFSSITAYESYPRTFWDEGEFSVGHRVVLAETTLNTRSGPVRVLPILTISRLSGEVVVHVSNVSVEFIHSLLAVQGVIESTVEIFSAEGERLLEVNQGFKLNGNSWVLVSENDALGWRFIERVGKGTISQTLGEASHTSIRLLMILLLGGLLLATFLSLNIYRPISAMRLLIRREQEEGRFDELSSIKKEIESMIANEGEQEQIIQLETARHAVHLLMHGIRPKEPEETRRILKAQRSFDSDCFVCCTVLVEYLPSFFSELDVEEQESFRLALPSLLRSYFEPEVPVLVIALDRDFYELVINLEEPDMRQRVLEILHLTTSSLLDEESRYGLIFGLGNSVEDFEELAASHNQALAALQGREANLSQVIDFVQLPPKKKVAFSFYDQKGIANNIKTGNDEQLGKFIQALIEKNEQRGIDAGNMSELYRQILLVGLRSLNEHGHHITKVPRLMNLSNLLVDTLDADTLKNLKGEMVRLFVEIQALVTMGDDTEIHSLVGKIKVHLQQHYHEPLSLDIVADEFGITAKYLSKLFKDETKVNFSDYLVRLRIDAAKRLLGGTSMKIGDIAQAVGLESRATFLRSFTKIEGITPSEYRKLELQKSSNHTE